MLASLKGMATTVVKGPMTEKVFGAAANTAAQALQSWSTEKLPENLEAAKAELKANIANHSGIAQELQKLLPHLKLRFAILLIKRDLSGITAFLSNKEYCPTLNCQASYNDLAQAMLRRRDQREEAPVSYTRCELPGTGQKILRYLFQTRADLKDLFYDILAHFGLQSNLDLSQFDCVKEYYTFLKDYFGLQSNEKLFQQLHSRGINWHPYMEFKGIEFKTHMDNKCFAYSTFVGCSFLDTCRFLNSDFRHATLISCHCTGGQFVGTQLQSSSLIGTHFKNCQFVDAVFSNAEKIEQCQFNSTEFLNVQMNDIKKIEQSQFLNARFAGTQIIGTCSSFRGSRIFDSYFDGAQFFSVLLTEEGQAQKTIFKKCRFYSAVFDAPRGLGDVAFSACDFQDEDQEEDEQRSLSIVNFGDQEKTLGNNKDLLESYCCS